MNPISRQHAIREYELFVSEGVQEVPESVFEQDNRSSGEIRVVRAQGETPHVAIRMRRVRLGKVRFNRESGEIVED